MKNDPPYRTSPPKPRSPGKLRAIALAVGVHAAFFALIISGVTWQSTPTPPVEAEIWKELPPVKAAQAKPEPPPEPKPPEPKPPEPKPEPKTEPKPEPKPPEVKPEVPKVNPEIALKAEREKKEKDKRERAEKEKRERLEKEKLDKKKEEEANKKREREELARKKLEDEKRRREEDLAKAEAEKARAARAEAIKSELERYKAAIQAKIRGRANVPDTVTGKPEVLVSIKILPGGEVLDITITKRSGNPTYDTAIERGIRSASPLPVPPADSELFPHFRQLNLIIQHER